MRITDVWRFGALSTIFCLGVVMSNALSSPCPRERPNGLYSHPTDCASFITCLDGIYYIKSCPESLHFNPEDQVCDWPDNVRCTGDSNNAVSTSKYGPGHPGGRIMSRVVEQFLKGDPAFQCRMETGAVPVNEDCGLFYRCNQWRSFLHTCKEQMIYDAKESRCVQETSPMDSSHCVQRNEFRCPTANGIYADMLDRSKYYNCWTFRWYHQTCPKGLVFNAAKNWCDYTWNVVDVPIDPMADTNGIPVIELQRADQAQLDNNDVTSRLGSTMQILNPPSNGIIPLPFHQQDLTASRPDNNFQVQFNQNQGLINNQNQGLINNQNQNQNQGHALGDPSQNGANVAVHRQTHMIQQNLHQLPLNGLDQFVNQNLNQNQNQLFPQQPFLDSMPSIQQQNLLTDQVQHNFVQPSPVHPLWQVQEALPPRIHHFHPISTPEFRPEDVLLRAQSQKEVASPDQNFPAMQQLLDDYIRRRFLPNFTLNNNSKSITASEIFPNQNHAPNPILLNNNNKFQVARKLHVDFRTPDAPLRPKNPVKYSPNISLPNEVFSSNEALNRQTSNIVPGSFIPLSTNAGNSKSSNPPSSASIIVPTVTVVPVFKSILTAAPGSGNRDTIPPQQKKVGIRRYFNSTSPTMDPTSYFHLGLTRLLAA